MAPPEVRGLSRDEVRLLVATPDGLAETPFLELAGHLRPGDVVVVNNSATLAAALDATLHGEPVVMHVAQHRDDGSWVVEVRPTGPATGPLDGVQAGDELEVHGTRMRVTATLPDQHRLHRVVSDVDLRELMWDHGRPIRYAYVPDAWPLETYQTVFARHPGSAEMPSAGRPFSHRLVTELACLGVPVAPVTLHTGVSSQEPGEPPQPEPFEVPEATARLVNHARTYGGRVVAVGTTVTRALESCADLDGTVHADSGWTDLVLGPERPARVVNGLVSGWHEPGASHLDLLRAVAGERLVTAAYAEAERLGLLGHEFGDSCLLLP